MSADAQTAQSRRELQKAANAAKQRFFSALGRLDTHAKSWAHGAAQASILTGLGLAGAATLWVGFTVIKRRRAQARAGGIRPTALLRVDPLHANYLLIDTRRSARLLAVLVASFASAWRLRTKPRAWPLRDRAPRLRASHRSPGQRGESLAGGVGIR
jgi:hypothetical protein